MVILEILKEARENGIVFLYPVVILCVSAVRVILNSEALFHPDNFLMGMNNETLLHQRRQLILQKRFVHFHTDIVDWN